MKKIATNVDTVTASIHTTVNGRIYLKLSGEIERFGEVFVEDIAYANGYEVDDAIDEFTFTLNWL